MTQYRPSIWGVLVASSSTFLPHPGRVIRDLFRLSHVVLHGAETVGREAATSTCPRIASDVAWFLRSTAVPMQLPHPYSHCQSSVTVSAGTDVGHGSLKQPAGECLTLCC